MSGVTVARAPRRRELVKATVLVAVMGLAIVAYRVATASPPAGGLRANDPAEMAALEQRAWVAYYYRDWLDLARSLYLVTLNQFGLSPAQSVYASYVATRAQVVFARNGAADGEAERLMRDFYEYVREPVHGQYDSDRAAALEVEWWVAHRNRRSETDTSKLPKAIAELYAELYQVPAAAVLESAQHRSDAMDLSDRWIDEGKLRDSPLLDEIRLRLERSYRSLREATVRTEG